MKDKIINRTIERLKELTGEDFHGYRSEVWSEISMAMEEYKESKVHLPTVNSRLKQTEILLEKVYNMYVRDTEQGKPTANVVDQIKLDEEVKFVLYGC